jgi:osmotically-inducible protein OsmY
VLAILVAPLCAQKQPITDDTITDQVLVKLANDPDVGGMKFEVSVHEGAVTLKGKVRTDKQKSKAEKLAKKVKGVTSVNNQLVISLD